MILYLVRHCEPEPGPRNDATRGLTQTGVKQSQTIAEFLRREIGTADIVITSPYVRALDTALEIAKVLGCQKVPQTNWLDPDVLADRAWDHIASVAGKAETVIVVTHHPLVNALLEKLTGAKTDDAHFEHGAIAHVKTESRKLHWFVTPKLVERDEEIEEAAADLSEAATRMLGTVTVNESLKHPKHAAKLLHVRSDAEAVVRRMFRRQKNLLHSANSIVVHNCDCSLDVRFSAAASQ